MSANKKNIYTSIIDADFLEHQLRNIDCEGVVSPLHLQSYKRIIELSHDYRNDSFSWLTSNKTTSPLSLYQFKSSNISIEPLSETPSILKYSIKILPYTNRYLDNSSSEPIRLDLNKKTDKEYLSLIDIEELHQEIAREQLSRQAEIVKEHCALLEKIKNFYSKLDNISFPAETNDFFDEKSFMSQICGYLTPKHEIQTNKKFFEKLKKQLDHSCISYTSNNEIQSLNEQNKDLETPQEKFVWKLSDRPKVKRTHYRKWLINRIAEKHEDKLNALIVSKPDFIFSREIPPKKIFIPNNTEPTFVSTNPNPYIDIPLPDLEQEFDSINTIIDKYSDFYFGPLPQDEDAYNLFLKKLKQKEEEPIIVRPDIDDYL